MMGLDIQLDGDGCWPDLAGATEITLKGVALLQRGTVGGRHAVCIKLRMPDGKIVFAQTTARVFVTAAAAVRIRCEMQGETDL